MKSLTSYALLSIHNQHADNIYSGEKKAELRKSFSETVRVIFLYETKPVSAVTGVVFVSAVRKYTVHDAVRRASELGIPVENAKRYFGNRRSGWVIEVASAVKFQSAVSIERLTQLDHYFSPPQAFSYLPRYSALTQELFRRATEVWSGEIRLRRLSKSGQSELRELVLFEVGATYEDIDEDFFAQIATPGRGVEAAFSTRAKHALEVWVGRVRIGYTVLTEKVHGSWKTGPTVLMDEYRGLGLGQAVRVHAVNYCQRRGARAIYCTCSASNGPVLSYLLSSGFLMQARLRRHLSPDRDEIVLQRELRPKSEKSQVPLIKTAGNPSKKVYAAKLDASDRRVARVLKAFLTEMPDWYFEPGSSMYESLVSGVNRYQAEDWNFSDKPRILLACFDGSHRPKAIAVGTLKRSNMLKVNVCGSSGDARVWDALIAELMKCSAEFRRIYVTLPITKYIALLALTKAGFRYEGQLSDPFGSNVDHVCLGLCF